MAPKARSTSRGAAKPAPKPFAKAAARPNSRAPAAKPAAKSGPSAEEEAEEARRKEETEALQAAEEAEAVKRREVEVAAEREALLARARARAEEQAREKARAEAAEAELEAANVSAADRGPLGGAWIEGTKLGEDGPVLEAGTFFKDNWSGVSDIPPEEGGVLGALGQEQDGGPPDRTTKLREVTAASGGTVDGADASALHCAFKLLFEVHQQVVDFRPDLNMNAAGQKSKGAVEDRFTNMVQVCNLVQHISRDVRSLPYSRFGREKCGLKNASALARKVAEGLIRHAAELKKHLNAEVIHCIR